MEYHISIVFECGGSHVCNLCIRCAFDQSYMAFRSVISFLSQNI